MGVNTRSQGELFVVTSDRVANDLPSKSAPKRTTPEVFRVWIGDLWSTEMTDAKTFRTMDEADQYVKSNSRLLMDSG